MKRGSPPGDLAQAQPYTAQATAPSERDTKQPAAQALSISWFGPGGQTLETQLSDASLSIGREPGNDLVLSGTEVSRRHAQIAKSGAEFSLIDLGSRNGLLVNGRQAARAVLCEGLVARLGDWVGVVARAAGGPFREVAPRLWGGARLERALQPLRVAARSQLSLIVTGETGTGKELVAQAVFEWSRPPGAFVPVNCAALSESILEAELFGHARGAFTGAVGERIGLLREADQGLLFLDEIGELPLLSQSKLLRVLQEQEVTPVGSSKRIALQLRVIAATHRDLRQLVRAGTFRADLLARLEGLQVRLPPLRERREDIVPLFLTCARAKVHGPGPQLTPELVMSLLLYDWPGNARELKQLADRAAVLHQAAPRWGLNEVELPAPDSRRGSFAPPGPEPRAANGAPKKRAARHELALALTTHHGVVVQAARSLGVSKQTLYKLIDEYAIDVSSYRDSKPRG
jgi:transcriptional regulator of acetoin/glycerol metabolism